MTHLSHVHGVFSGRVPADFGGVCNIDFEGWKTNVWELIFCDRASEGNGSSWEEYRNGYQVRPHPFPAERHPELNALAGWGPV